MTSSVGTGTGSISLTGLLGGTAGQIDVTSLISSLMQAASVPQAQLQDQLTTQQSLMTAYQGINTDMTNLQVAAQALTDPVSWSTLAATSSDSSVAATVTGDASAGSTTFSVLSTASPQTTTIALSGATALSDPSAGLNITVGGTTTNVAVASGSTGSPADVAAAINQANLGITASVVNTDQGTVLQLVSSSTGTTNGSFSVDTSNLASGAQVGTIAATNAQIEVGDGNTADGGYTISSQNNTFTNAIPGVTFTVSATTSSPVTIGVATDETSVSNLVQNLVTAANTAEAEITNYTGQGGLLQGTSSLNDLVSSILESVSNGTSTGGSLLTYGIDINSSGQMSFDPTAFAQEYANDPTGTQNAIMGFANALNNAGDSAVNPAYGSVTSAMSEITNIETSLNTQISNWTTTLSDEQTSLQTKYTAMETALASLQTQQTYITQMFNSMNGGSSSSSSSSS